MMQTKILKGLTKKLIAFSKNKELCFSKDNLQMIKQTAEVRLTKHDNGDWSLNVYTKYDGSCCGNYLWRGSYSHYKNSIDKMEIFSGFTANPIGQIDRRYECKRPVDASYKIEFETILQYMLDARKSSLAGNRAYCDFVKRTGCLD